VYEREADVPVLDKEVDNRIHSASAVKLTRIKSPNRGSKSVIKLYCKESNIILFLINFFKILRT